MAGGFLGAYFDNLAEKRETNKSSIPVVEVPHGVPSEEIDILIAICTAEMQRLYPANYIEPEFPETAH